MTIEIMNLKHEQPTQEYDFRCDRKTIVGNPFPIARGRTREQSIALYANFFGAKFSTSQLFREYLYTMRRVYHHYGRLRLFCWCAPEKCHTEIIRDWIMKP